MLRLWLVLMGMTLLLQNPGEMRFPDESWEVVIPEAEGLDAAALADAVETLRQGVGRDGVGELLIVRRGRVVWQGENVHKVHGIWSCTKSFTSTAFGLLIADGKCELLTRAADFHPKLEASYPDVTFRHFTTMTSGYRAVGDAEAKGGYLHGPSGMPFEPADPLFAPGEKFAYWDSAMNTFGLCLTRAAGESLEELLTRRILDPIGVNPDHWRWGNRGQVELDGVPVTVNSGSGNGGGHVQTSAWELARFGHLFLNRGRWRQTQLIPADWVDQATSVQVPAELPDGFPRSGIEGSGVYGFNWWVNGIKPDGARLYPDAPRHTYLASGHNNNRMWVVPEWEMVIVRLGLDEADRRLTDQTTNVFLKAVGAAIRDQ